MPLTLDFHHNEDTNLQIRIDPPHVDIAHQPDLNVVHQYPSHTITPAVPDSSEPSSWTTGGENWSIISTGPQPLQYWGPIMHW
jgi:hypothetical protein